jgi:drug/metabolite transporter (DMT)-like permease
MAFFRWVMAFLILLPFTWKGLRDNHVLLIQQFPLLFLLGILGMGICGAIVYLGLGKTQATNAALIYATSPLFIVLIDRVFFGRPIATRQVLGIALAFSGMTLILMKGSLANLYAMKFNDGDILIGIASMSWAAYSTLQKRKALSGIPILPLFSAIIAMGALILAPFSLWEITHGAGLPVKLQAWASIFGVALLPSVLAFSIYKFGIKTIGPSQTGVFLYFMPVYAALLAVAFLGEHLQTYHIFGFFLVLPGVMMAAYRRA